MLGGFTAEEVTERVERIKEKVEADKLSKEDRKAIKQIESDAVMRMDRYKEQLARIGDCNSYFKTDPDATLMRMKEDAMLNGQSSPVTMWRYPLKTSSSQTSASISVLVTRSL